MRTNFQNQHNGIHPESFAELNSSHQVREIQRFLIQKGYNLGRWGADGDLGRMTKQAIYDYIKAQLNGGGHANPQTPITPPDPGDHSACYSI